MRIAIIGSRQGFDSETVNNKLYELFKEISPTWWSDIKLLSGGAKGIDNYAAIFAKQNDMDIEIIRPINPNNKIDYLFRNIEIITKAYKIIAFWDGKSRGTKFVIDYAKARNKEILILNKGDE